MAHENIFGIIPPLVTPFRADGSIDEAAHRAEVRWMVEVARVHGLAVCGSTGEGHTLSLRRCGGLWGGPLRRWAGGVAGVCVPVG